MLDEQRGKFSSSERRGHMEGRESIDWLSFHKCIQDGEEKLRRSKKYIQWKSIPGTQAAHRNQGTLLNKRCESEKSSSWIEEATDPWIIMNKVIEVINRGRVEEALLFGGEGEKMILGCSSAERRANVPVQPRVML